VDVGEEPILQVVLQRALVVDRGAVLLPRSEDGSRGQVGEAIVVAGVGQEPNPVRECCDRGVDEIAFSICSESAERNANAKAHMICRTLGFTERLKDRQRHLLSLIYR